ncbi:hypothetical protein H6758_02460 [Candidatus Nomurabacteria bacterium]|nr:hypothetical protein [Candidatus Nomurabacteria bacterium]
MIEAIKTSFLDDHKKRGFTVYDSFPLVIDDPTILFTNATVTPFKPMFTGTAPRHNFALVQRCLRLGGSSGSLDDLRTKLQLTSLFDMLGSGLFGINHEVAVAYFIEVLEVLGLSREHLVFSAPSNHGFKSALLAAGIAEKQIFMFDDEESLKHEWSFGEGDLHGIGVVARFVPAQFRGVKFQSVLEELDSYVQLGRIVHIDGVSRGSDVEYNGFGAYDLGIGLGRVEIALSGDCSQTAGPWRECTKHLQAKIPHLSTGDAHYMANLFQVIEALLGEGLLPGKKKHASALRKVLRKLIEEIWIQAGGLVDVIEHLLASITDSKCPKKMKSVIRQEEDALRRILARAEKIQQKHPEMTPDDLRSTFGIRPQLINLNK